LPRRLRDWVGWLFDIHPAEASANIDDVIPFEQRKATVRGCASTAGFAREQVNKAA
jgi:hypothetical protein